MPDFPRRIGVIDVGSNSVRFVVFETLSRSPAYFFNEKVVCGLGRDLSRTGRLSPEGMTKATAAIRRFMALAGQMQIHEITGIATAAMRDAEDGPAFREFLEDETGINLRIASGTDEARYAAQGVMMGWPRTRGLVADLGGASLELARISRGKFEQGCTMPLGPLRLNLLETGERQKIIQKELTKAPVLAENRLDRMFLVGGAWRALARVEMERTNHSVPVVHEFEMGRKQALELAEFAMCKSPSELGEMIDASAARLAVLPTAAQVLHELLRMAEPRRVAVSAYGLREGILYDHMSAAMLAEDPLLSSAHEFERRMARFPGFGTELGDWLIDGLQIEDRHLVRLVRAACLLSDTSWNSHPDQRAEACVDLVNKANLSGLKHEERAFLAAILRYRYKAPGHRMLVPQMLKLINKKERLSARMIGRGIRLGAMICGAAPGVLRQVKLVQSETEISLVFPARMAPLASELVEKRLQAVARQLDLKPKIVIKGAKKP